MGTIQLPPDFREFLRLLDSKGARYLLIGGYAVGYHGYPRPTGDMDVWVDRSPANVAKVVAALHEFGFDMADVSAELFADPDTVVRFGYPPLRLELLTDLSGLTFDGCYAQRIVETLDGIPVSILSLNDLRINKRAAGRGKDIEDLRHLPRAPDGPTARPRRAGRPRSGSGRGSR